MSTSTTRWRVAPVGWVVVALAIIAEAASNALGAYALGANLEAYTVAVFGRSVSLSGAVLVIAAVAISITQSRAIWVAFTTGPLRQRIVASMAGLLLVAVSATAMSQHLLKGIRFQAGSEKHESGEYDRTKADFDRTQEQLDQIGTPRPVKVIQAEVQATKIDMVAWRRSNECSDITRDDTRKACEPILALYKERGAAASHAELTEKLKELSLKLNGLRKPVEASQTETAAAALWAWLFGAAVVFVATFGSVLFARVETVEVAAADPVPLIPAERIDALRTAPALPVAVAANDEADCPVLPGGFKTKQEALLDLLTLLAMNHEIPSQDWLAARWGDGDKPLPKGTVSKWLRGWEGRGLITRSQAGRCKAVSA